MLTLHHFAQIKYNPVSWSELKSIHGL